ncbi:Dwil\GK23622-PA-like protein [Anopheles sinensis]|uniref:Dwil\GK23622-PA-like protein n=1 Tax=Anopheles sinensis TaxID=74873 RepID=A0A084VII3_ANOSI|nr:Dwil\GK23622-PA-like protein [Anopheles sinensis]
MDATSIITQVSRDDEQQLNSSYPNEKGKPWKADPRGGAKTAQLWRASSSGFHGFYTSEI